MAFFAAAEAPLASFCACGPTLYAAFCRPGDTGILAVPVCRFALNPANLLGLTGCLIPAGVCPGLTALSKFCLY